MDKYLIPATSSSSHCSKPINRRAQWKRSLIEIKGKIDSSYRHDIYNLSVQSYSLVGAFRHIYHIDGAACPTHVHSILDANNPTTRRGVSALEFDSKGIYLASVTKSGCLTVHDFDDLYCPANSPLPFEGNSKKSIVLKEDEKKQVFHISTCQSLDVVRWNPMNQYEVACTSRKSSDVKIFDLGYISSEPIQTLRKRPTINVHGCNIQTGLSDISFSSNDNSRVFASDMIGIINIWDRRMNGLPCFELKTNFSSAINSINMNTDNQVMFGANKHGIIYMWDLRGGNSSSAFQNNRMANNSPMQSIKLASELEKIDSLKAQSNIVSKEILSIDLNPSVPNQLAFHLDDGWSGVFNIHNLQVTHVHCPPPPWLDNSDDIAHLSYLRKPSWLPIYSVYAVGSSSSKELFLLDFYPDKTSPCHVDYSDDVQCKDGTIGHHHKQNVSIPLSEGVTACAVHPLNGTIVAGTQESSLVLISQTSTPSRETNESSG